MQCRYSGQAFTMAAFYTAPMALRIRTLRESKGWTQAELAARSRMSRSQLAQIEAETRPANTLRLNSIAAALGVNPEDLFASPDAKSTIFDLIEGLDPVDREIVVRLAESLAAKSAKAG